MRLAAVGPVPKKLRAVDVERLAEAGGLRLESFAFGIRGIPERGWALVWVDGEGRRWMLLFPNLWAVHAYLVSQRNGAPGPVRLADQVRENQRGESPREAVTA